MKRPDRYTYHHEVPVEEIENANRVECQSFWWAIQHWAYGRGADLFQYRDHERHMQCWDVAWDAENWTGEVHEYWMCKLGRLIFRSLKALV